jgi:RNA polymerase sigma factor (sigma-70 family)
MDSDAFLRQVGAIALLSAQDEVDLARRMRAGAVAARELTEEGVARQRCVHLQELVDSGDAAREQMVQANLRLVVSVARRYRRSGVPMLDLVQEGTVGLIQAVDRFDPDRGCRFSTYAMWWIRQAINRGLADAARQVRLPRSVQQQLSTCHARRQELMARLGREPSRQELAAACGLSVAETVALLQADPQPLSLDVTSAEDNDVAGPTWGRSGRGGRSQSGRGAAAVGDAAARSAGAGGAQPPLWLRRSAAGLHCCRRSTGLEP